MSRLESPRPVTARPGPRRPRAGADRRRRAAAPAARPGPRGRSPTASWRWRSRSPPAYAWSSAPGPPPSSWTPGPPSGRTSGAPPRPDGVYDLVVDGRLAGQGSVAGRQHPHHRHGHRRRRPAARSAPAPLRFTDLPDGHKDVEIWLPHDETTELVALRTDAPVEPAAGSGPPGLAAPRQLHQPGLQRRPPHRRLADAGRGPRPASTWSTSASAAARCSTRSPPARCGTPPPT